MGSHYGVAEALLPQQSEENLLPIGSCSSRQGGFHVGESLRQGLYHLAQTAVSGGGDGHHNRLSGRNPILGEVPGGAVARRRDGPVGQESDRHSGETNQECPRPDYSYQRDVLSLLGVCLIIGR